MSSDHTMAYAARFPGMPGYGAVVVDDPKHVKSTAKTVADYVRRGASVERVTLDEARKGMGEYLAARKAQQAAHGPLI